MDAFSIARADGIRSIAIQLLRGALKVEHLNAWDAEFTESYGSNVFNIKCSQ